MQDAKRSVGAARIPPLQLPVGAPTVAPSTGLSLSPYEAFPWLLGGLACAVLITQFFEHAVIATLFRLQWHRSKSYHELSILFYQIYWASAAWLAFVTLLWLYASGRWAYKAIIGLLVFVVVEALQLSIAILLTSWKDMAKSLDAQLQRPWLRALRGKASVTQKTV